MPTGNYIAGDKAKLTYLHSGDIFALVPTTFEIMGLNRDDGFGGQTCYERDGKPVRSNGRPCFYRFSDFLEDITVTGDGDGRRMAVTEGDRFKELHMGLERFKESKENWLKLYRMFSRQRQ